MGYGARTRETAAAGMKVDRGLRIRIGKIFEEAAEKIMEVILSESPNEVEVETLRGRAASVRTLVPAMTAWHAMEAEEQIACGGGAEWHAMESETREAEDFWQAQARAKAS